MDTDTGITFQSTTNSEGITYRLALPADASADKPYDVILQVVAPIELGWVGWAWGGSMTYNPLTVVWADGKNVVYSSRQALYVFPFSLPRRSLCYACTGYRWRY